MKERASTAQLPSPSFKYPSAGPCGLASRQNEAQKDLKYVSPDGKQGGPVSKRNGIEPLPKAHTKGPQLRRVSLGQKMDSPKKLSKGEKHSKSNRKENVHPLAAKGFQDQELKRGAGPSTWKQIQRKNDEAGS